MSRIASRLAYGGEDKPTRKEKKRQRKQRPGKLVSSSSTTWVGVFCPANRHLTGSRVPEAVCWCKTGASTVFPCVTSLRYFPQSAVPANGINCTATLSEFSEPNQAKQQVDIASWLDSPTNCPMDKPTTDSTSSKDANDGMLEQTNERTKQTNERTNE